MYEQMVAELKQIRNEVLDSKNSYQLDAQQKKNFTIVLNTLSYIATEADIKESHFNRSITKDDPGSFYPSADMDSFAIIHFEELKGRPKESRKDILINALVKEFIDCYKIVKDANQNGNKNSIKEFAENTSGLCIDVRTRGAFDFARRLGKAPTFNQMVGECTHKLGEQASYFSIFGLLLKEKWGSQYSAEEAKKDMIMYEIGKKEGTLNSDKLAMVEEYFKAASPHEPESDFLQVARTLPKERLPVFYKYVLQHQEFLSSIEIKDEKEGNEFNEFMLVALLHEGRIEEIPTYLNKISPERFIAIVKENNLIQGINKLSEDKVIAFLEIANKKLEKSPENLNELYVGSIEVEHEKETCLIYEFIRDEKVKVMEWLIQQKAVNIDKNMLVGLAARAESMGVLSVLLMGDSFQQNKIIEMYTSINPTLGQITKVAQLIINIKNNEKLDPEFIYKNIDAIQDQETKNKLAAALCAVLMKESPMDPNVIILWKKYPAIVNYPIDLEGNNLLHLAVDSTNKQLVSELVEAKVDINKKNTGRNSPILSAAMNSKWDSAQVLLERKEINRSDIERVFVYAVKDNQEKIALSLLSRNIIPDQVIGNNKLSALHYAIINNNLTLAKAIFENLRIINFDDGSKKTPLISAAENKGVTFETLEWLLSHEKLNLIAKYNNKTVFQIAIETNQPAFNKLLHENNTPLVNYIVEKAKAEINMPVISALLIEVYLHSKGLVKLLENLKGKLPEAAYSHLVKTFTNSMLQKLIDRNDVDTLKFLIEQNQGDLLSRSIDIQGNTILHLAVKYNKPDIIQLLLDKGALPTLRNVVDQTPIEMAAENKAWDAVMQIAKQPPDSEDKAKYGKALLLAAEDGPRDVVIQLLKSGTNLGCCNEDGFYPIHFAIEKEDAALVKLLCEDPRSIQTPDNKSYSCVNVRRDKKCVTPLIYAIVSLRNEVNRSPEFVQILMDQKNIDIEQKWAGKTALQYAEKYKHYESMIILMRNNSTAILELMADKIKENRYDIVAELLKAIYKNKGDIRGYLDEIVKISDKKNLLSFFLNPLLNLIGEELVKRNDITLIRHLHALDPTLLDISGLTGGTSLLHIAAKENAVEVINELVKLRVDITDTNSENQSMLLIAAENNAWDVLSHVKEMKEMRDFEDADKALFVLSKKLISNDEKEQSQAKSIISTLIDKGISVSYKDTQDLVKLMPVHYAVMSGDLDLVKKIFSKDPNPNARVNADSPTPLILAMKDANANPEVIFFLMKQKGIDLSYQFEGKTALEYAIELNPRLKRKLFGADSSDLQLEILAAQIKNGDVKSAKILLDVIGKQPKANIDEIIEKLIKAGVKEAASLQEAKPEQKPEKKPEKKQEDHYQPGPSMFGNANKAPIASRQSANEPIFPEAGVSKKLGGS